MYCEVETLFGRLRGKESVTYYGKKYFSFEGIPYAKPPIGKLRFRAPQEPETWTGIRDATKPGNKCCQLNPYSNTSMEGSEDCLYLNVYTPSLPYEKLEKLPVLFFVHGGRLIFGYGDYYKPDYIMKHDVIVVTINYRLHVLGFLCLNTPEVPGNAALKDTVMALRWVRNNIERFNGDFNNVTVFGESAGAAIVSSYMTSKMADGLFSKVIAQSGNLISDIYMMEDDAVEKAKVVASNLGKDITDVKELDEFLTEAPIEDLIIAFSIAEINRHPSVVHAFFLPVVEKEFDGVERFFDEYPRIDVPMNRYKKVPVLTGMNSYEGAFFIQKDTQGNVRFENDLSHFVPFYLHLKKDDKRMKEIERKIRKFYFNDGEISETKKSEYVKMLSDRLFNYEIMLLPEMLSKCSNDIFFYKFQYAGNLNTRVIKSLGLKGSTHGDMIQYQFYRQKKHEKCNEKDIEIVEMLSEAWCNFARNGKPSWKRQETEWLPYTSKGKHSLIIDEEIKLVRNPDLEMLKFWTGITGETSKL